VILQFYGTILHPANVINCESVSVFYFNYMLPFYNKQELDTTTQIWATWMTWFASLKDL